MASGGRKVQASSALAALRKLLVRLWWCHWEIGEGEKGKESLLEDGSARARFTLNEKHLVLDF